MHALGHPCSRQVIMWDGTAADVHSTGQVPSGRQMVDTRMQIATVNISATYIVHLQQRILTCTVRPRLRMSERSQGRWSIPLQLQGRIDRNRYYNCWTPPPMCLPSMNLTSLHMTYLDTQGVVPIHNITLDRHCKTEVQDPCRSPTHTHEKTHTTQLIEQQPCTLHVCIAFLQLTFQWPKMVWLPTWTSYMQGSTTAQ